MDYIRELRALVGHRPLLLCGAGAIILNEKDQVLLQLRTDNGCWGLQGGCMEPGETTLGAMLREVREETGLMLLNPVLFNIYSGPEVHNIYPNGDECYFVDIIYIADRYEGEIAIQESELSELRYFDIDRIPENLNPGDIPALRELAARYREGTLRSFFK